MKIGLISDLHIDINEDYDILGITAAETNAAGVETLIVAGDISETPERTLRAMEKLDELCQCPVYYVPGNHDMWNKNCPEKTTTEIEKMYKADVRCLLDKTIVLGTGDNKLAVVGDIGWYDYSLASSQYSEEEMERMSINGRTWQDHYFNQWTGDNKGHMMQSLLSLADRMEACGDTPILAVTHMIPIMEFCVPETQKDWGYFNGFLGSKALHDLYKNYPVKYAVCGHVHYRSQVEKDKIKHICPCLGYHSEWSLYKLDANEARTHIQNALYILEV